jgi:hypothetical protein
MLASRSTAELYLARVASAQPALDATLWELLTGGSSDGTVISVSYVTWVGSCWIRKPDRGEAMRLNQEGGRAGLQRHGA